MINITIKNYDKDFIDSIKRNNVTLGDYPNVIRYIVTLIIEKFFDEIKVSKPYRNNYQSKMSYSSYDRMELSQQSGPADISELWVKLFGEPKDND
jgi:hypothetical protein